LIILFILYKRRAWNVLLVSLLVCTSTILWWSPSLFEPKIKNLLSDVPVMRDMTKECAGAIIWSALDWVLTVGLRFKIQDHTVLKWICYTHFIHQISLLQWFVSQPQNCI
jgi:hypothetical protein